MASALSRRMLMQLLAIDVVMTATATATWMVFLDVRDVRTTVALCVAMFSVRVLILGTQLTRALRPARAWLEKPGGCSADELLAADGALNQAPVQMALAYIASGIAYFSGLVALFWFAFSDVVVLGQTELVSLLFLFGSTGLGPPAMMLPMLMVMLAKHQEQLGAEITRRRLEQSRAETPIGPRLIWLIIGIVISALCWLAATMWIAQGDAARTLAEERLSHTVQWSAHALRSGEVSELPDEQTLVLTEELPAPMTIDGPGALGQVERVLDKRAERVTAAAALGDGRWVLASESVEVERGSFWISLIGVVVAVILGGGIAVAGTARSLTGPLAQLRETLNRVVEIGDLREIGRIPIATKDEIGVLIQEFNAMLDMFEKLAGAALVVASGDLRVDLQGEGDLQDAFRAMVTRLTELVIQIRTATIDVSSAAAEIAAAVSEQEGAANRQSEGVREVSLAMRQLEGSAMEITAAAEGVLLNARESRERSDEVATKIADLGEHIARISELLGLIREIADRSDLLALNGSLEATRAGEAGRGFELVAKEMRRLAERVATTVADVRETVAAIESAKRETEHVTDSSRKLADGTTAAAQQIVDHTGTQSAQTELVASNIQGIVDLVMASVSATEQTGAVAESLHERAETLRRLVEQFEVEDNLRTSDAVARVTALAARPISR